MMTKTPVMCAGKNLKTMKPAVIKRESYNSVKTGKQSGKSVNHPLLPSNALHGRIRTMRRRKVHES